MKLHANQTQHYQTVTGYEDDSVEINAVRFQHSLLVMPESAPVAWPPATFSTLSERDFDLIEALRPDLVILGTGQRQRFVHPRLTAALNARRIGVECMDNKAACRTYNILMAEGRKVALALVMEAEESPGAVETLEALEALEALETARTAGIAGTGGTGGTAGTPGPKGSTGAAYA